MPIDEFLLTAELLPETCLLVGGEGLILAANQSATQLGVTPQALRGRSLYDITSTPKDEVGAFLQSCARSRRMLPGSLIVKANGREVHCHCQGAVFRPRTDQSAPEIFLRLSAKEHALTQFIALNQRLGGLSDEIRRRKQIEEQLREQTEKLQVTLTSIGEGVIATDDRGRVSLMNPTAEMMTGWTSEDAMGRSFTEVFQIVNEMTRQPAENPCNRVLREGIVLGLANHTVLIARDGTERAIDDSASPIKDATGIVRGVVFVFRDVSERRKGDYARSRLAAIVESSEDAIISKNLQGIITSWNHAAEEMFGYTAAEAIGKPISLLSDGSADEMRQILERVRRGERVANFETTRRRKDGTSVNVSLTVSPVRDEHGEVIGASKIARDISDRKRADREREVMLKVQSAARAEAERANRMKDEFLATVSHEIRTPLNAILGWSQILRSGKCTTAEMEQGLEVIERNTRVQSQLVEDLLDMSRIISGKVRLDITSVDLAKVIESAIATVRLAADSKNITITTSLDPALTVITGDAARLQQVVWNLLSNAIKFTPSGGRVDLRLARRNSHVELTVTDTGQGIPAEFLPYVFDRFRQADSSTRRPHSGLGLGLAIVKQLVELHGGGVAVTSKGEGQGATFIIDLPLMRDVRQQSGDPELHLKRLPPPSLHFEGIKILVVDDDPDCRKLVERILQSNAAMVITADSAAAAMELLHRERPDVLISDIGMPHVDGYDFIRNVRKLPLESGGMTPAAALTAFARTEDRTRALLAGFQTHVPKPIEPAELLAIVASLTGRTGQL